MPSTFREKFCAATRCGDDLFEQRIFWSCLYRRAFPLAWLTFGGRITEHFTVDRDLIRNVGMARRRSEVKDELVHYFAEPANRALARRRLHLRLSTKRLLELVSRQLEPDSREAR